MAGVKGRSGRKGGNPDLKRHQFTTERSEPLNCQLQFKVSASLRDELQSIGDWQEFARQAIARALVARAESPPD